MWLFRILIWIILDLFLNISWQKEINKDCQTGVAHEPKGRFDEGEEEKEVKEEEHRRNAGYMQLKRVPNSYF